MPVKPSVFPNDPKKKFLEQWCLELQKINNSYYQSQTLETTYGPTRIFRMGQADDGRDTIVFLPGFRTCGLFWDLTNRMKEFAATHQVVLVDVIGQPSLSSGITPDVKGDGYSIWLGEILDALGVEQAYLAGASFGCQLSLKFAGYAPQRVKAAFLFAPAGFNNIGAHIFSNPRSAWYNMLPMLSPTRKNIDRFLRTMIFLEAHMPPKAQYEHLLVYFEYVMKNFKNHAQLPYRMSDAELQKIQAPIHVLVGDKDPLISAKEAARRAQTLLPVGGTVHIYPGHAHGMETADVAFDFMLNRLRN